MAKVKTRRLLQYMASCFHEMKTHTDWVNGGDKPWRYLPYGVERRAGMLAYLRRHGKIYVNRKWQLQTKHDMDLKRLLKKGRIRLQKAGMQSWVELV